MTVDLNAEKHDPMQLPDGRRALFWRAYWHERVIGGRNPRASELSAMIVATAEFADDQTTTHGERMWWKERGAL